MKYSKEAYDALEKIGIIAADNMKKLYKIKMGDDWSFIIKIIAIVESALNRLLTSQTKDSKFEKIFSKISISSKLSMAYELGFFTSKYEKTFLEFLITLRNKVAHDPDEMDFSFEHYFKQMSDNERNDFKNHMKIDNEKKDEEYYQFIFKYPKEGILIITNSILSVFAFRQEINKVENWIDEYSLENKSILSGLIDTSIKDEIEINKENE
jgi:hypothetical protein